MKPKCAPNVPDVRKQSPSLHRVVWTSGPEETEGQHLVSTSVHISWTEVHKIPWGTVLRESPLLTGMVMLTEWPHISPPVQRSGGSCQLMSEDAPAAVHTRPYRHLMRVWMRVA